MPGLPGSDEGGADGDDERFTNMVIGNDTAAGVNTCAAVAGQRRFASTMSSYGSVFGAFHDTISRSTCHGRSAAFARAIQAIQIRLDVPEMCGGPAARRLVAEGTGGIGAAIVA